jgi:hypothetical protein
MLFSSKFIIKVYRDGQTEPHLIFSAVCQMARLLDQHTLKVDSATMHFGDNEYVVITETQTE